MRLPWARSGEASGTKVPLASPAAPASAPPPLLATGLRRNFGHRRAVDGIDLHLGPGELVGLVGPDGAGKTTTLRLLAGLLTPDAGEVRIVGLPVAGGPLAAREALGYMPQQYSLYGDLSVAENLSFFGELYGLSREAQRARERRLLLLTRLQPFRERRAEALSGGMYKKLALACALLHRPRVLLLDEPTNGVDPVSRRELWELLHELVAEGMAVLVATPYMDEAARCHRVGLLHEGRLLAEGEPERLLQGFSGTTLLLTGGDRTLAEELLSDEPAVIAFAPQGAGLRLVVREGEAEGLRARLADRLPGAELATVRPDFEDLFLGLLALAQPRDPAGGRPT